MLEMHFTKLRTKAIDNDNLIVKRILALKGNDIEGKRILLFQGGIGYGRGLDKLVKSAEFLKEEWAVVFIGWGSLQSELELLAASAETLDRKVFFLPKVHRDELGLWTRCADIGIIPYEKVSMNNWYCSPNKLWEYPSCSVPILVSPNPYLREIVEENNIGWVLPEQFRGDDIAFIVNKLDEDEINNKRGNCDRYSRQNCWDNERQKLKEVYASL